MGTPEFLAADRRLEPINEEILKMGTIEHPSNRLNRINPLLIVATEAKAIAGF